MQNPKYICAVCNGFGVMGFYPDTTPCKACAGSGNQTQGVKPEKKPIIEQFRLIHVFRRMDYEQVRAALIACNVDLTGRTEKEIYAAAHTIRLTLIDATPQEKAASETFLRQNGYTLPAVA